MTTKAPLVSVLVFSYNHKSYIAKALESVLIQQVEFEYEIIVGDDASTDGTGDILYEYKVKHPHLIHLVIQDSKVGVNGNTSAARRKCRGKYIALLDGDDYWTCPHKLQTQIEFLEKHPEYSACGHGYFFIDANGDPSKGFTFKRFCKGPIYTLKDVENGYLPRPVSTLILRNYYIDDSKLTELYDMCDCIGDNRQALLLALKGPVYCLSEIMAAYRYNVLSGSSWSATTKGENLSLLYLHWVEQEQIFAQKVAGINLAFNGRRRDIGYHAFVLLLKTPSKRNREIFAEVFRANDQKIILLGFLLWKCFSYPFRMLRANYSFCGQGRCK